MVDMAPNLVLSSCAKTDTHTQTQTTLTFIDIVEYYTYLYGNQTKDHDIEIIYLKICA